MPRILCACCVVAFQLFALPGLSAADQETAIELVAPKLSAKAEAEAKHETISSELRNAIAQKENTDVADSSVASGEPSEIDLLKMIEVTIAQQRSATATMQQLQSTKVELETQLSKLSSGKLNEEPPYSILMLDRLNDSIASGKVKRESLEEALLAARGAVERARFNVDSRAKTLRQLGETNATDIKTNIASRELRLAEEILVLRRQELGIEEASEAVRSLEADIDLRQRELILPHVVFSTDIIEEKNKELDEREVELNRKADELQIELQYAERRWMSARQQLDSTVNRTAEMLQKVESLQLAQKTIQVEQSVNNQRIERLPIMRANWDRRFRLANGQCTRQERTLWLEETLRQIEQFARERRARELKLDETRANISAIGTQSEEGAANSPELTRWMERATSSLIAQTDLHTRAIIGIDSGKRALERLRVEIEGEPNRSVGEWMSDAWGSLRRIWNYEITNVNDTSLTVGRAASCMLFIVLSYFLARFLSRLLGNRLPRLGIDEAAANSIQSLTFYALLLGFTLAALRYANVPLTAFTFLGGAIAIGVGFGSQNILNNFISGLILLAERPIKTGDLILIDGTYGNVIQIGARSTQIRSGDNLDIIVPNSRFLENNVVNLTRSDDRLRTSIKIGVAYGSSLDLVMQLLQEAADENEHVHREPKPFVWFNEFGDNALEFQVNFWINVRSVVQRKTVETQVRLSIDQKFREHGISIAFPQRDIHLSSSEPLEFRMIREQHSKAYKNAG
ncbi:Mechanosensitive channel MscK precursor [Rubripirellula amarantea]|uniref:Mechanosensitive channel MscK n=1 Tax=Rubripirellula amarantea TaxID=2527999 RepID=A0A5C5WP03_9BACT|nr:mechanosensitive ion channel domain-containing protein [Rubripirellula amarantea]TWT52556.1 Mechanosensitive channel MscK precursor [Rubripirellula amarantea]